MDIAKQTSNPLRMISLPNLLQVEQNLLPMSCLHPETRIRKRHQTRLLILPAKNVLLVTGPMSLPRSVVAWPACRTSLGKSPVLASCENGEITLEKEARGSIS
ncbi:hypothetical protein RvY_11029-2 [Ramazzottius varieornatus]|uniref:Uncharacterized protein n=1 Tax=Ramazzottius varieornatus TaxID=947166 RepID=A0A1D1VNN6_RAMVA|nr:hypothetical protein RvY_11029-2 [Ramazzottius varieornatus]